MRAERRAVLKALFAASALGIAGRGQARAQARAEPVLVFAASSLQSVLQGIADRWQAETGIRATLSFAATSALARQIEAGAPADVFISADPEWMGWAEARRLIQPGSRRALVGNALVLVAQKDDPVALPVAPAFPLASAIGGSRLATGNPGSVPLGRYAQAALTALGVWADVRPRLAGAENARAALALVRRGEARFGIVYATDAMAEAGVRVVGAFPPETHPPIIYPVALTARSTNPAAAAFVQHLASPDAIGRFRAAGFRILP